MTKLVTIDEAVPSDQFQFGGEILNQIVLLLSGSALDSQEDIKLDTTFKFYSGRFALVEEDPTHAIKIVFKVENIDTGGDKSITYRNPTVTNDFAVTEKQIQVLENKVLGTNTQVSAPLDFNNNQIVEAIIDGDLNTLQDIPNTAITSLAWTKLTSVPDFHGPFTFTIYQTATQYVVKNNHTGTIQSFSNSDFAPALIWAVNNVVNVGLGTQSSLYGGTIFLERGKYIATTTIAPTITTALRHGIAIIGEEWGTEINFNPPSGTPLTDGFLIDMAAYSLKNIRVTANQYVTNLIHLIGHSGGANRRNDHFFLQGLQVEGPNGNAGWATLPPISGQVGILIDGTNIACYYSTIKDCKIHSFEKGIWFKGLHATSVFCKDNSIKWCETGIEVSDSSGQLQIDGAWIQGDYFSGTTGIKIASTAGGYIYIDHITSEIRRTDNGHAIAPTSDGTPIPCQTVLIETGIGNCYIGKHITNAYDGAVGWGVAKTIVNNSTQVNHTPLNWGWKSKNFFTIDPDQDLVTLDANRRMAIRSGMFYLQQSNGFNYIFSQTAPLAASRVVNLPVLLGPDQVTFDNHITALAGKTIDSITNTVKNLGSYKYTIFKDGSTYYCRNNLTGAIDISNTSPNTVLQYPLTQGGSVYVQPADYILTGSPSVYFDFPTETTYCHFEMSPMTRIMVPLGSTSTIFRFKNGANHCTGNKLVGGFIRENGTGAEMDATGRNWTGILFEGSGNALKGVFENVVDFTRIWDAGTGVRFNSDSTCISGFVTSCILQNMMIYRCKNRFIDWTMDIAYTTNPINGSHRNRFDNLLLQNGNLQNGNPFPNLIGVNNVFGRDNKFDGVYCADFNTAAGQKSAVIAADSDGTLIDGGTMTLNNFEDNSSNNSTNIRDMYRYSQIGRITPGIGGNAMEIVPVTGQLTNTTSWWDANKWERFYIQKTSTDIKLDSARSHASGVLRPVLFRINDTVGGGAGTIESFRMEIDGGLRVANNKFKLRDGGSDHNIIVTVPDVAGNYNLAIPPITGNDSFMTTGTAAITNAMVTAAALDWAKINKAGSVLSDISNVVLTTPADQDILVRNSAGNWVNLPKGTNNRFLMISSGGLVTWAFVGDVNLASHTSTKISITNKAQLNSQIAYKDETAWLSDAMMATHTSSKVSITSKAQLNPQIGYKDETGWVTESMTSASQMRNMRGPVRGPRRGSYEAAATTAGTSGIFNGNFAQTGSTGVTFDNTNGQYNNMNTGAVSGNGANLRSILPYTIRQFNPYLGIEFMITTSVANNRLHIGFKSVPNTLVPDASDDPLVGLSGIMLVQRAGDTDFFIASNNATGTTFTPTGIPIVVNTFYTIEFRADETNTKFQYSLNGGTWTDITATIPSATAQIGFYGGIQTAEGLLHNFRIYGIETTSEK